MVLAILVISVASGAEPEFQVRIILFCLAADGAFMFGDRSVTHAARVHGLLEIPAAFDLLRLIVGQIPGGKEEDHKKG